VPVVAHPWTAGGLEESSRDAVVVAEDAREWCDAVAELLTDKAAAQRLASRGLEAWDRSYRSDRVAELVREVVLEATRGGR
jgi:glycosyltransferase involved in cell wall biosynthesis